jgi:hypothetical protein
VGLQSIVVRLDKRASFILKSFVTVRGRWHCVRAKVDAVLWTAWAPCTM